MVDDNARKDKDKDEEKEKEKDIFEVIVNGQLKEIDAYSVTFADVIALAFPDKVGEPDLTFVVTYRKAYKPQEGSLAEGGAVEVKKKGTVFNVTFTRRS